MKTSPNKYQIKRCLPILWILLGLQGQRCSAGLSQKIMTLMTEANSQDTVYQTNREGKYEISKPRTERG